MASPAAWLREQGFDPEGDLTKAIPSKRDNDVTSTAMYEAAIAGELGVCRYLWEHGARDTIRTKTNHGSTPMVVACAVGHLDVAQWLFEVGAAADIRIKSNHGFTPMLFACKKGHLAMAQWLFKVGAAGDIRTNDGGTNPMYASCYKSHLDVAQWLLLQGAANGENGHVDRTILHEIAPEENRPALRASLLFLVTTHATFVSTMLPATTRFQALPQPTQEKTRAAKRLAAAARPCVLARLRGHEETLLALIADFVGVVRGRQLRNAREALPHL
jgi:hypothetical protein